MSAFIGIGLNFFLGGIFDYILFKSEVSQIEYPTIFSILYLCIVAPIGEEFIFRKCPVALSGSRISDKVFVALLSSFLFSAVHNIIDISTTIITFLSAITFYILLIKTKNILYPIIAHSMFNIISVIDATGEYSVFSDIYTIIFSGAINIISIILILANKSVNNIGSEK